MLTRTILLAAAISLIGYQIATAAEATAQNRISQAHSIADPHGECVHRNIRRYDDGRSSAEVIARVIHGICKRHTSGMMSDFMFDEDHIVKAVLTARLRK